MSYFSRAIVRTPGRSLISGLSMVQGEKPVYKKALMQHQAYIEALEYCGLDVVCLEPLEEYPDSVFVEDVAVIVEDHAIISAPSAPSRSGETAAIMPVLDEILPRVSLLSSPAMLDGGDVMVTDQCCYVGISQRTNQEGATQLFHLLASHGLKGQMVPVDELLHLKTGITWLGDEYFIATGSHLNQAIFSSFSLQPVDSESAGAANCIAINDKILMPAGYPNVQKTLEQLGREIITVDISEFAKIDGGLTCLSLRF